MIESLLLMGLGALLARTTLWPLQGYLEHRQQQRDDERAAREYVRKLKEQINKGEM